MIMNYNLHYYNYDLVRTFHFLYTHSTTIIRRLTVTMVTTIAVMVVAIATPEHP